MDQHRITAEHEAAHALAFDVHGLSFARIDARVGWTGPDQPRAVHPRVKARVSMAGQAVDAFYMGDLSRSLAYWLDTAEYEDTDEVDGHDIANTPADHFLEATAWAFAFVQANSSLISSVADAVDSHKRVLTFAEFAPYRGRAVHPARQLHSDWAMRLLGSAHRSRTYSIIDALRKMPLTR